MSNSPNWAWKYVYQNTTLYIPEYHVCIITYYKGHKPCYKMFHTQSNPKLINLCDFLDAGDSSIYAFLCIPIPVYPFLKYQARKFGDSWYTIGWNAFRSEVLGPYPTEEEATAIAAHKRRAQTTSDI